MKGIRVLSVVLLLGGCAAFDASRLVPGQSSGSDVQKALGRPTEKRIAPDGEIVLWYPLRYARVSYAARIGKDDRLIAIEQRITQQNFDRLRPGLSRQGDVRDLLGPPGQDDFFPRQQREVWAYEAQGVQPQLFILQFSADGVLREKYVVDDGVALDGSS